MVKYIVIVDGVESTKYKYNLWKVFEYEDGTVSQNSRAVETDNLDEFIELIKPYLCREK